MRPRKTPVVISLRDVQVSVILVISHELHLQSLKNDLVIKERGGDTKSEGFKQREG